MVARVTMAEIDAVRTSVAAATETFNESVLPALREQDGYDGAYVLLSAEGKVLVLSFWESDELARASRLSGFYAKQLEKFVTVFRAPPGREAYDVVAVDSPTLTSR